MPGSRAQTAERVHLRQALPGAPGAHDTFGRLLFKRGEWNEAIDELQAFVEQLAGGSDRSA